MKRDRFSAVERLPSQWARSAVMVRPRGRIVFNTAKVVGHRSHASGRIESQTTDMVGYWDRDLICRGANEAYLDWFGRTPDSMLDISMTDLLGSVFRLNERYIMGALAGDAQTFERALVRTDGTIGYTLANYVPDLGPNGKVRGFLAIVTDITPLRTHR